MLPQGSQIKDKIFKTDFQTFTPKLYFVFSNVSHLPSTFLISSDLRESLWALCFHNTLIRSMKILLQRKVVLLFEIENTNCLCNVKLENFAIFKNI